MRSPADAVRRLGVAAGTLALVVLFSQLFLPQVITWNDEASYVSTAFKIAREGRISSAVHVPEDILRHGTDHKPVHMPAYMVVLALWLSVFSKPVSVLVLNQLLFATAILLLHRVLIAPRAKSVSDSALALFALLASPLALAYASTAMMESFVIFLGAAWFVAWLKLREHPRGLYGVYLLTALCLLTRQTLVFLFVAALLADTQRTIELHRRLLRGREAVLLVAWIGLLALVCAAARHDAGYYPNFFTRLGEAGGLGAGAAMVARNFASNLAQFTNWSDFPHDYFYSHGLALFLATLALAFSGGEAERLQARTVALFWGLTLLATNLLYENYFWRSHRLVIVCAVLSSALIVARLCTLRSNALRVAALGGFLAFNLVFCAAVLRTFPSMRITTPQEHPLTTLALARPGDLLFSEMDFLFLRENPRCELMSEVPADEGELRALIDRAHPRFVLISEDVDLKDAGYRSVITVFTGARPREPRTSRVLWTRDEGGG